MAIYRGIRALGNMKPNERSAVLQQARAMKQITARLNSMRSSEQTVVRSPGLSYQRGASAGGNQSPVTTGTLADRPRAEFLTQRGVSGMLYIAVDSGVYWWSGTAWTGPL